MVSSVALICLQLVAPSLHYYLFSRWRIGQEGSAKSLNAYIMLQALLFDGEESVKKRDKTLYEVEIKEVDAERRRIKIHLRGYSDAYDEWRPYDDQTSPLIRKEHVLIPCSASGNDRKELFHDRFYKEIKRNLHSGRKEHPNVRIKLSVEEGIFYTGIATVACRVVGCNREIYRLDDNRKLDGCLGVKWDERIQDENGDYGCFVPGTVQLKKAPIIEYKLIGQKYIRSEV